MDGSFLRVLSSYWKGFFQSAEQRSEAERANAMADELISLAQDEWQLQFEAVLQIPDLVISPKYAHIMDDGGLREIKSAFLLGHLLQNSRRYDFPTTPEARAFVLLINLLVREGTDFEQARQETIALRRVIENGDELTRAMVYRGEASVEDPVFHPHVADIVVHMSNLDS